ncbi:MAG: NAD-dependent succinate-semialdehyde dehydrogenase [Acidobacteriota bacterium]|nr:NAD-dependent succinate-semialdehyde dehydrogenase [Acidobacteriota bacterium]MDE3043288.1 NAD-dependent succinate-semialdehyde dehydrogenase [Acidobacteriota bacterium]MDE3107793.1 NAD-dependent succinate-semialdehyde dehydrogenase [Acidobacteriota bacterium]MDE3222735.1 NAD-dependent succinate-semialdehyde dehydrogenase [Acidobacteriota bacterium]
MSLYQVVNPATGETVKEYPTASDAAIADALAQVAEGYQSWRSSPMAERTKVLHRVADLYRDRADELAAIITREMGKTTAEALGEIEFVVDIYRYYADHGPALLADAPLPSNTGGTAWVRKSPVGAILGIMPWNYPYYQVARFAAPNVMIGNTIVLKHAPQCPESALAMEQLFRDAGLPANAYVNVFATNEQVADMIADPRICGVSVTGSERAGSAVAALAGQHLKKVVLELGGSDPFIVLDTDDLDKVVSEAVGARMENGGQACNAAKRFIVADTYYDAFVDRFSAAMASCTTGEPTSPDTTYGPLSSEQAVRNLQAQVDDAIAKGATVRTGGRRLEGPGAFFEPSVLTDVTPEMRAFREELFGPVAVVYRVKSVDEAVALANDTPYGLGASIYSTDEQVALEVANRLDTGMVWINAPEGGGAELPFGGTKRSGVGRELGPYGIEEFVNKKLIHAPSASEG